jgi:hypothetical protein
MSSSWIVLDNWVIIGCNVVVYRLSGKKEYAVCIVFDQSSIRYISV